MAHAQTERECANEAPPPPKSLLLRLKRKWFDAIVGGYKTEEYRRASEYWRSRIENRAYDTIMFRNGYGPTRPTVLVEYKGWDRVHSGGDDFYAIRLGKPLKMWNFELPAALPCPSQCSSISLCPTSEEMEQQLQFSPLHHMWLPRIIPQLTIPVETVPLSEELETPAITIPIVEDETDSLTDLDFSSDATSDDARRVMEPEIRVACLTKDAAEEEGLGSQTIEMVQDD